MKTPSAAAGSADMATPGAIAPELLGSVALEPTGAFVAGSYATFSLTYTAGLYGIDDSGGLRICFRFATDQGRLQFDDPKAPNYTIVTASNNATLECRFDAKANIRPWDRTLYIKVIYGFLKQGDTITVRMGVTDAGSPGLRLQTFCEDSFEMRVLVDPIATFHFQPLPIQPTIKIVPGPPVRYLACVPTRWPAGEPFALKVKGEDLWGNPSDQCDLICQIACDGPLQGAPDSVILCPGARSVVVQNLKFDHPGDYVLRLNDEAGALVCTTNPIQITNDGGRHAWCDLHGQSEETIGTNSAEDFFVFARDLAFIDVVGHQGNDFQITKDFWATLNRLTASVEQPGTFIALPGYEWSGNTGLGGDRNVYFPIEGRTLRRSSHALVADKSDLDTDCPRARDLFDALAMAHEMDAVVFAHCGGRYADISLAHDGRFERSVEIHSSWGTFDWILHDAFDLGYRVGIVANSDGHKGRPGASYPGTSLFGAIGGLTCLHVHDLTRDEVFDCLRKRHHYATSGGPNGRLILRVEATFGPGALVYQDDPAIFSAKGRASSRAMMGDIVQLPTGNVTLHVSVTAGCPVERIEVFNGRQRIELARSYAADELGCRIRLEWAGARYRGRFRQVIWDGGACVENNGIVAASGINFFNPEKRLRHIDGSEVAWQSMTTGNNAGCDLYLMDPLSGSLQLNVGAISTTLPIADICYDDLNFAIPGELPRTLRVTRLPDTLNRHAVNVCCEVAIADGRDNPIYARVTLEDGTVAWSSPIYLYRSTGHA